MYFYQSYIFWPILFMLGASFGSFAACIGSRLFKDEKLDLLSRSRCDSCKKVLSFLDLIPIISYLIAKGKCKYCKTNIPFRYFLAELLSGLFLILIVIKFGITVFSILFFLVIVFLTIQAVCDLETMYASDFVSLLTVFVCFGMMLMLKIPILIGLRNAICVVVFFLLLRYFGLLIIKRDSLGFGDLKLFFALCMPLSTFSGVMFVGLCGLFGIVTYFVLQKKDSEIPFVPAILPAFFLAMYFDREIVKFLWY